MTVKELIKLLLDESMDAEVIFRDKDGRELDVKSLSVVQQKSIGALFG